MAQDVCPLCRTGAHLAKEFDQESGSLVTAVECPRCGRYRLTPRAWTSRERSCLAAYVQHENKVGRRPPRIADDNWKTLVRIGEALLQRQSGAKP